MSDIPAALDPARLPPGREPVRVLRTVATRTRGHLPHRPRRPAGGRRPDHGGQPGPGLRVVFAPKGREADRPRPGNGGAGFVLQPPHPEVGRPLPVGRRTGRPADPNRPRDGRCPRDEPADHPRHPSGGGGPPAAPADLISPVLLRQLLQQLHRRLDHRLAGARFGEAVKPRPRLVAAQSERLLVRQVADPVVRQLGDVRVPER
jgi:hypothetical protein